jgi:hypothetical protein
VFDVSGCAGKKWESRNWMRESVTRVLGMHATCKFLLPPPPAPSTRLLQLSSSSSPAHGWLAGRRAAAGARPFCPEIFRESRHHHASAQLHSYHNSASTCTSGHNLLITPPTVFATQALFSLFSYSLFVTYVRIVVYSSPLSS